MGTISKNTKSSSQEKKEIKMNTKVASRGMISKLQRFLLAVLAVMIVFSSLPVRNAQAATYLSYHYSVRCGVGSYQYNFTAVGDFKDQMIIYRLYEYAVQPNGGEVLLRVLPSSTQWYWAWAQSVGWSSMYGTTYPSQQFSAPKNTFIRVKTVAWFQNFGTQTFGAAITGTVGYHSYYNIYTGSYVNGSSCLVS